MTEKMIFNLFLIIAGFILLVYYVRSKKVEVQKEEEHVPLMTSQIHKDLEAMANVPAPPKGDFTEGLRRMQSSLAKLDEVPAVQIQVIDEDSESCLRNKKVRDPSSELVDGEKFFIVFGGFRDVVDGFVEEGKLKYDFNHQVLEVLDILEEGIDYICLPVNSNFYVGDVFNVGKCSVMFNGDEVKAENFIYVEHRVTGELVYGKVYVHAVTQKLLYVNTEEHYSQGFSSSSAEYYAITRFFSASEIEASGDTYKVTDNMTIDVCANNAALKETDIEIGYSNLVR